MLTNALLLLQFGCLALIIARVVVVEHRGKAPVPKPGRRSSRGRAPAKPKAP